MRGRFTVIITVVALIALALIGYAQVTKYLENQARAENALADAKKSIARVTAATEASLSDELDKNSATTYAELFNQTDDRVKMVDTAIIDIQASDIDPNMKKALAGYLSSIQNVTKLRTQMYRKGLAFSNNIDELKRDQEDYASSPYNEYSDAAERRRIDKARSEATTGISDFKEAQTSYLAGLVSLRSLVKANRKVLPGFTLIGDDVLAKVITKARAS